MFKLSWFVTCMCFPLFWFSKNFETNGISYKIEQGMYVDLDVCGGNQCNYFQNAMMLGKHMQKECLKLTYKVNWHRSWAIKKLCSVVWQRP